MSTARLTNILTEPLDEGFTYKMDAIAGIMPETSFDIARSWAYVRRRIIRLAPDDLDEAEQDIWLRTIYFSSTVADEESIQLFLRQQQAVALRRIPEIRNEGSIHYAARNKGLSGETLNGQLDDIVALSRNALVDVVELLQSTEQ